MTYGVVALYVPLALAVGMLLLNWLGLGNMDAPPHPIVAGFLFGWLALLTSCVWQAGRGRRWARVAVTIVTFLSLASAAKSLSAIEASGYHPLFVATTAASLIFDPLGTIALFLPRANAWYRAARPAA